MSLIRFARSVLAQYERTRDEIAAVASGAAGRTRVGSMSGTLAVLLTRGIELLKTHSPQATVLVEEGDLMHLLPKLRLSELDFFIGRLEPGYAAPDLVAQALHHDSMVVIIGRDHPLANSIAPDWSELARLPCVLPPPWASLRIRIEQEFHRHGLAPPVDLIETSSYFGMTTFVNRLGAAGFVARSVGEYFEREGLCQVLDMEVALEVAPVGLITLRDQQLTATTLQLIAYLRQGAQELFGNQLVPDPARLRNGSSSFPSPL